MNMQVGRVGTRPLPAEQNQRPVPSAESQRASRRLYLPTIVIAGLAAWLSYRGWSARLAPWLVLPRVPGVPGWCFVGLAVIGIDAAGAG